MYQRAMSAALLAALIGLAQASAPASAQTTERVSVASDGTQANGSSNNPAISADGRFVAFDSPTSNLVPGDTNNQYDVFVHDRTTGATTRVSVDSAGNQANSLSFEPAISADGRYVAFTSYASNLLPGDTNYQADVFVHDRTTGATTRVSVDSAGNQANGFSGEPAISADGRYVAFTSSASNLVPGGTNNQVDVFVHDRTTGATTRVSVDSAGNQANSFSGGPAISADGRYVAFTSYASNLVPGDSNGAPDVFLHDRATGATTRVSVDTTGNEGNSYSLEASISADGRYVAFTSSASNLVPGDTNNQVDVFMHDRTTGATTRVSVDSAGNQVNGYSFVSSISADGRYVAFSSNANNLVPSDTNYQLDIFVRDRGPVFQYVFIGFDPPVKNPPTVNKVKAGSAVPIKWRLEDLNGSPVSDLAAIESVQFVEVACPANQPPPHGKKWHRHSSRRDASHRDRGHAEHGKKWLWHGWRPHRWRWYLRHPALRHSHLRYDRRDDQFVFVWKTQHSMHGSCIVFVLTLADGQQQFADFRFK